MWPLFILLACAFFSTRHRSKVVKAVTSSQQRLIYKTFSSRCPESFSPAAHSLLFPVSDILYDAWNYVRFTHQCSMTSEKHPLHELTSSLFQSTNEQIIKIMLSPYISWLRRRSKTHLRTGIHDITVVPNPCWLSELFQLEGAFTWIFLVSNSFFRWFQRCTRWRAVQSLCLFVEVARAVCSGFPLNPGSCL